MNNNDLIQKLFEYQYEFAKFNIVSKFLFHFNNAYKYSQQLVLEHFNLSLDEFVHNLEESIKGLKAEKISTNIDSNHFPKIGVKDEYHHFTDFGFARLYYCIPDSPLWDKKSSSFIINFHINYLQKVQNTDMTLDDSFRFLIHFLEIIHTLEKTIGISNIENMDTLNNYPVNILEYIENGYIKGLHVENTKGKKNIFVISYSSEPSMQPRILEISSTIVVKSKNYLESVKNQIAAFQKFLQHNLERKPRKQNKSINVTEEYQTKHGVTGLIVTEENSDDVEKEIDNDEEKNEHKANKKISIRSTSDKKDLTTKKQQNRRLSAKSMAIAKSKMQLISLYNYPTISEISLVLKGILSTNNEKNEEQYFKLIFLLAIVLGLTPKKVMQILKEDIQDTITRTIPQSLHAKFKDFDETIGIKTQKYIIYKIPKMVKELLTVAKETHYEYTEEKFTDTLQKYLKSHNVHFSIKSQKLWDTFFIHQSIFYKMPNVQSILATGNLDQNSSPLVAYTQISQNLSQHSIFLEQYLNILDIDNDGEKTEISNMEIMPSDIPAGSLKLIQHDCFGEILQNLATLAKNEIDSIKKFNLYSLYVRYSLAMLIGTRDFNKSVNLSRVSLKYKTIHIEEKGKHENDGHRIIPLCESAKQLIEDYIDVLKEFNINEKNICFLIQNGTSINITNANTKLIQKKMFFDEKYAILKKLHSVPLNVGRHTIATISSDLKISKDNIMAFMGHNVSGGEFLGTLSAINAYKYETEFRLFLEEIAMIFNINKNIKIEIGIF